MLLFLQISLSIVLCNARNGSTGSLTEAPTATRPLSVLLVSPPFAGHIIPFLALGEELVQRGHNVTVVTAPTALVTKEVERFKLNLRSVGDDFISSEGLTEQLQNFKSGTGNLQIILEMAADFQKRVLNIIDNSAITSFDIMVVDVTVSVFPLCFSRKWKIPTAILWPSLSLGPFDLHAWPFPSIFTGYSDNLNFYQRLVSTVNTFVTTFFMKRVLPSLFSFIGNTCNEVNTSFHQVLQSSAYLPQIITTSFGFEFPRISLPLTEYVGPIISRSRPHLSPDIEEWLDQRDPRSVVYVSMGTVAVLTIDRAEAIINGATQANYSVVWSLRKSNQNILDLMTYDSDKVLVSSWIPQLSLLQHPTIHSAVLHGGLGGIQEALSSGIPSLVIPFMNDQLDNAVRVQYYHYGASIFPDELTAPLVTEKLKLINSEFYRKSLSKIQRIYKKDGGASRAADLLEFYSEFGYDHLVPSYAKYNWSWVEFYNVDVYTVLVLAVLILSYLVYRLIRSCCAVIFSQSKKKDE